MSNRIQEIKDRLNKARKDTIEFKIEDRRESVYDCPVCDNCPLCQSEGAVDGVAWNYENLAAGFQVFGIGEDVENLEEFAKHAPDDIAFLLEEIERLKNGQG